MISLGLVPRLVAATIVSAIVWLIVLAAMGF